MQYDDMISHDQFQYLIIKKYMFSRSSSNNWIHELPLAMPEDIAQCAYRCTICYFWLSY